MPAGQSDKNLAPGSNVLTLHDPNGPGHHSHNRYTPFKMSETNGLTRLQFVEAGAARAAVLGSQAFEAIKYRSGSLKPRLEAAEAKAAELSMPILSRSAELLKLADTKVSRRPAMLNLMKIAVLRAAGSLALTQLGRRHDSLQSMLTAGSIMQLQSSRLCSARALVQTLKS